MNKKILITCSLILTCASLLGGCEKSTEEKELSEFSTSISSFTRGMNSISEQINNIDPSNAEAKDEFLNYLDQLELQFNGLNETPIPDQYISIRDLASEAEENMAKANSYYKLAFENDTFNSTDADIAYQYYVRAMTRVKYIGYVLSGEVPDTENVTVLEETNDSLLIEKLLEKSAGEFTTGEIIDDISSFINK